MGLIESHLKLNFNLHPDCRQLELLQVQPGTFLMGYTPDSTLHLSDSAFEVQISKDFWLGKYPVTQAQWQAVMGYNPSEFRGENLPVENVDWFSAKQFCKELNKIHESLSPKGYEFNLPTEAQWEYACRSNTKTKNYLGDDLDSVFEIAWCLENSRERTQEIGLKQPNQWGFYDMFGNVFEWCFDMIVDYPKEKQIDWIGFDHSQYLKEQGDVSRIVRGGSCFSPADSECFDAAERTYVGADTKRSWYGFRVCLGPINLLEE
jgi:formylglycine-generating enzyme required for sulfatase activity